MNYLAIYICMFFGGAALESYRGQLEPAGILIALGIPACILWLLALRENQQAVEFLKWLKQNRYEIESGCALYRNLHIRPSTMLRRYESCVSLVVPAARFRSRFFVAEEEAGVASAIRCLLTTLLFGFWAIPCGPVYSLRALVNNLAGGRCQTVASILLGLDAEFHKYVHNKADIVGPVSWKKNVPLYPATSSPRLR